MAFSIDPDYIDVATRIVEFREKHPDGSLQQHALDFRSFGGSDWVIYTAAAYRSPDDPRPGHGTAWEQVPGKTNFTRASELQNAETAAWGRAIVAVLAADTKRGVASADEVRNRQAERQAPPPDVDRETGEVRMIDKGQLIELKTLESKLGKGGKDETEVQRAQRMDWYEWRVGRQVSSSKELTQSEAEVVIAQLRKKVDELPAEEW